MRHRRGFHSLCAPLLIRGRVRASVRARVQVTLIILIALVRWTSFTFISFKRIHGGEISVLA